MPNRSPSQPIEKLAKSDETRNRILSAALESFRQRGFEAATMREIASSAGVATGAAYYYFDSKDAIVLAFYERAQREMAPRLDQALSAHKDLRERLRAILNVKLEYFEPSRHLLRALTSHTDPEHPLSPFGLQTREIREKDIQFFERALAGSRTRVPEDLKSYLPRILWMYQMGVILFWIHDRSAAQGKTSALIDKSLRIVVGLIKLSGLPLTQPLRRLVRESVDTVAD